MDLADPRHWFRSRERPQSDGPGGVDPDRGRIDRPVRDASGVQRAELAPHPLEARVIEILGLQGQQLGSIKSRGQKSVPHTTHPDGDHRRHAHLTLSSQEQEQGLVLELQAPGATQAASAVPIPEEPPQPDHELCVPLVSAHDGHGET